MQARQKLLHERCGTQFKPQVEKWISTKVQASHQQQHRIFAGHLGKTVRQILSECDSTGSQGVRSDVRQALRTQVQGELRTVQRSLQEHCTLPREGTAGPGGRVEWFLWEAFRTSISNAESELSISTRIHSLHKPDHEKLRIFRRNSKKFAYQPKKTIGRHQNFCARTASWRQHHWAAQPGNQILVKWIFFDSNF